MLHQLTVLSWPCSALTVASGFVQSKGGAFVGDTKDFLKFTVGDHAVSSYMPIWQEVCDHIYIGCCVSRKSAYMQLCISWLRFSVAVIQDV